MQVITIEPNRTAIINLFTRMSLIIEMIFYFLINQFDNTLELAYFRNTKSDYHHILPRTVLYCSMTLFLVLTLIFMLCYSSVTFPLIP